MEKEGLKVGVENDVNSVVRSSDILESSRIVDSSDILGSSGVENDVSYVKYNKVITKSLILWILFFLIGIGFSIYHYFIPLQFTIDLTKGLGWKAVFSFVSICATKYIWIISILCIFFTFGRKENPRYFSFILGFYILLLIFCVIGVVI